VICYAPDAYATPPNSPWDGYQCANANWRFLKKLGTHLLESSPSLMGASEKQVAQRLLLDIVLVNLDRTAKFLDYISSRMDEEDWRILPRDFLPLRETRLVDVLGERILLLRTVEDAIANLSSAIECLSRDIRAAYLKEANGTPAALSEYLDALSQDCDYYKTWSQQLKTKTIDIHEVTVSRFNVKQSSSVSQLTLLAAFFLPLSLAAGVLSMQTRFADLNLLLFDFVGVVVILATIALIVGLVNRYGLDFIKMMIRGHNGRSALSRNNGFDSPPARYMRIGMISLWWAAILSSFLVGMVKDVVFGLKVFGFEVAGVLIVGWAIYGVNEWAIWRQDYRVRNGPVGVED
jgi:hypothetical protein